MKKESINEKNLLELKKSCKKLKTDLIESVDDANVCCEKCEMYRNRIYSLSGRDRRFPKFPTDFHWDCRLNTYPFVEDVNIPSFRCRNIVKHSNRPFVDDRTARELKNREEWLQRLYKSSRKKKEPDIDRIVYFRIAEILPSDIPKTVSSFKKMRNADSKKYQEIVEKATSLGFIFST